MKNELKEIHIKSCACYYFDDVIDGTDINFSDILLDEKLYENISVYDILCWTSRGLIIVLDDKIKYLILFDYGLFNKICDNKIKYLIIKKVVLQIVVITILEISELIHIILWLLKKNWPFIIL